MGILLYFSPGLVEVNDDVIVSQKLAHAFDRQRGGLAICQVRVLNNGPGGKSGVVFSQSGDRDADVVYKPGDVSDSDDLCIRGDKQTWHKSLRYDWWMGWWNERPPSPRDLLRQDALAGSEVELNDDQAWSVPTARSFSDEQGQLAAACALPTQIRLISDEHGFGYLPGYSPVQGSVLEKFRPLWEIFLKYDVIYQDMVSAIVSGKPSPAKNEPGSDHWFCWAMTACLSTNYRIGVEECNALGLLDARSAHKVLRVLGDYDTLELWSQKKSDTERDGTPSPDGQGDSIPATDPPAQT